MKNNLLLEAFFESVDSKEDWNKENGSYYSPKNKINFEINGDFPLYLTVYHNKEYLDSFCFGCIKNRKIYKYYKKMKANIKEKKYQDAFNDLPVKIQRKTKLDNINTNEYERVDI